MGVEILSVTTERREDATVIRPAGEVDMSSAEQLRTIALAAISDQPARLELDLGGLQFLDSSGLGALLDIWAASSRANLPVTITEIQDGPRRVIEAAGLAQVLLTHTPSE